MANTTSNLSELMQTYYDKQFLIRAEEELVLQQFGQKKPIPKYEGKTVSFQRYSNLAVASTALTEGTNPSGSNLSATNVTATVAEYGDFVKVSSLVSITALDPNIKQRVPILAHQMAQTLEYNIFSELGPNATAQIVSTQSAVSDISATDVITMTDLRKGVRTLQDNNALKMNGGYFVMVVDPYTLYDLQSDTTWVDSAKYSDVQRLYKGEAGKWFGVRVVLSTYTYRTDTSGTYSATGAVHSNLLIGEEAYGLIDIKGGTKKVIVKTPGPQDTGNPLNMYNTVGWYTPFVCKTLNANFILNIKTGATA